MAQQPWVRSRRSSYLLAALLLLMGAVLVWLVFRARVSSSAAPQSLAADVAALTSPPGKWRSEVVKLTFRDGQAHNRILDMEFVPVSRAGQSNAPDAQAKLHNSSLTRGIPGLAEGSAAFGDGSFRDVRLRETNGMRTMTITRAVAADDRDPAKTQRIYDRFYSVSFRYELKKNVLTLKGFPTTNKVTWGVSEFLMSQEEVRFKASR
jgi:hypothetical protein